MFARASVRGGERRLQPPLIGWVSPPISFYPALINDTGRQRKTSQFVVSRVLADVYSIWELLFVWCLQSGRCSPLFWDTDTWMQPGSHLMRPRLFLLCLFLLSPLSVTQSFSSSPILFFSHKGRLDVFGWPCFRPWHRVPGTALCSSHRGRECENTLFLKRTENTKHRAKSGSSLLQIVDVKCNILYTHWLTWTVICNAKSLDLVQTEQNLVEKQIFFRFLDYTRQHFSV